MTSSMSGDQVGGASQIRPSGRSLLGSPRLRNHAARGLLVREVAAKALSLHLKFPNAEFTPPARRH